MKQNKMKSQKQTGETGWKKVEEKPTPKIFDGELGELDAALYYAVKEVMDNAFIPCFLLGETARQIVDGERLHQLPAITLGIRDRHLTEDTRKILIMLLRGNSLSRGPRMDWEINENLITFDYVNPEKPEHPIVPIKVQIIKVNHEFFEYPDTIFYDYTEYRIPNSFKGYWEVKDKIK